MHREEPRFLQSERRRSSCRPRSKKLAVTSSTRLLLREAHKYLNGAPASARHLQSRVDLNKLHASVPTLLQSGAKHAHCSCRGPQRHLTPTLPRFFSFFFPASLYPSMDQGSEGYFTRPLRSANLSPTFGGFLQIGISWGAEQSAMRWPSSPTTSTTTTTVAPAPSLPHPAGGEIYTAV